MASECEGSGRDLPAGPPPDEATTCPVCGRETKIEASDDGDGDSYTVARHDRVAG